MAKHMDAGALDLEGFVANMQKQFAGSAVVYLGRDAPDIERCGTGSLVLDWALHGGWPRGRISQLYGPPSSGKTTAAIHACKVALDAGGTVFWGASEDFDWTYAVRIGVNPLDPRFVMSESAQGNVLLDTVLDATYSGLFDIVVVDSIASLRNFLYLVDDKGEFKKSVGKKKQGGEAAMIGEWTARTFAGFSKLGITNWEKQQLVIQRNHIKTLKETPKRLKEIKELGDRIAKMRTKTAPAVLAINQVRKSMNGYNSEPGGMELKHGKSVDVHFFHAGLVYEGVKAGQDEKDTEGRELLSRRSSIKVNKCKVGVPYRTGDLLIGQCDRDGLHVGHFDRADAILQMGLRQGIIEKAGNWHTLGELRVNGGGKFVETLRANDELLTAAENAIREGWKVSA